MVKQLEKDLPNRLAFFSFPKHLWKQLRTTNIIERCFVEGETSDTTDGLLCKREKCGPNYLFHFLSL